MVHIAGADHKRIVLHRLICYFSSRDSSTEERAHFNTCLLEGIEVRLFSCEKELREFSRTSLRLVIIFSSYHGRCPLSVCINLSIMCDASKAEIHILENEEASRGYIAQMWAEMMTIYGNGKVRLKLPKEIEKNLIEYQRPFIQEDTWTGLIQEWLDHSTSDVVCVQQIYNEALKEFGKPRNSEAREIGQIMNWHHFRMEGLSQSMQYSGLWEAARLDEGGNKIRKQSANIYSGGGNADGDSF